MRIGQVISLQNYIDFSETPNTSQTIANFSFKHSMPSLIKKKND